MLNEKLWSKYRVTLLPDSDDPDEEPEEEEEEFQRDPVDQPPVTVEAEPPPAVPPSTATPPPAKPFRPYPYECLDGGAGPKMGADPSKLKFNVPLDDVDAIPKPAPVVLKTPDKPYREWSYPPLVRDVFKLRLQPHCYPSHGIIPRVIELVDAYGTPPEHGWGIALAALATVLGRHWRLDTTSSGLPSNLYLWLLSDSSGGKSLALNTVSDLLGGIPNTVERGMPRSSPAYIEVLQDVGLRPFCWAFEESGAFFRQIVQAYAAGLVENICTAYDGAPTSLHRAEKRDREAHVVVEKPLPTHLICGTAAVMRGTISYDQIEELFGNGLFGRFLFIPGQRRIGSPGKLDNKTLVALQQWFVTATMARPPGGVHYPLQLTEEATYERDSFIFGVKDCPDPLIKGAWGRAGSHAEKLAVLYHASMGHSWDEPIEAETMMMALHAVHSLTLPTIRHLSYVCTLAGIAQKIEKLRSALLSEPAGMFLTEVTRRFSMSRQEQAQVLAVLDPKLEYSTWARYVDGKTTVGRPLYYVAAKGKTPDDIDGYVCKTDPKHTFVPAPIARELDGYIDMPDDWRSLSGPSFGDPVGK